MVRTVPGPTDRVVVVGAGLAGLAAALHLRGSGREVTVLERDDGVGGRVGVFHGPGYDIDSGATVLTMPELVDEALAAVGATAGSVTPPLRIHLLDPSYHARFADGSALRVHADEDAMADEIARVCGPEESIRYRRLRAWLATIFDADFDSFMDANFDSPLDLVRSPSARRDLVTLVRHRGFGRLGPQVARLVHDPRLQRIFTFQALYAGVAPSRALGVYGAIAHMDTSTGVYFPEGGMRRVAEAMASALTDAGGRIELDTKAASIDYEGDRAVAVRAADGTVPVAVAQQWRDSGHHTIDFGAAWSRTFREITARAGRGRLMSDPSLLLTRPACTDPALRLTRDGELHEPLSVLAPCPNLRSARLDWAALGEPYVRELLALLESRGYTGIAEHFRVDLLDTPLTWAAKGMADGSPFAAAHLFVQTGPFRRGNLDTGAENVVLAGCGTTPGVGVPTVLLSGKLAAARIACA